MSIYYLIICKKNDLQNKNTNDPEQMLAESVVKSAITFGFILMDIRHDYKD